MSLPLNRPQAVPRATVRVARQAFPKGNVYLSSMRDEPAGSYAAGLKPGAGRCGPLE